MAIKTDTKEIDGNEYSVTQMAPSKSAPLLLKLIKQLSGLKDANIDLKSLGEGSEGKMLELIMAIAGGLDEKVAMNVVDTCLKNCKRDGKTLNGIDDFYNFDADYDVMTAFKVSAFVLKVNFGGALKKLGK